MIPEVEIMDVDEPVRRLGVKRGVICFIKTERDYRTHFFTKDAHQDDVPDDFLPLRFPDWTKKEAIDKFLCESVEIKNPISEYQA